MRDQILEAPDVFQMPVHGLEMYVVRNFLSAAQCAELIAIIDANRIPSPVVADDPVPAYRTSETCYLYPAEPVVAAVEAARGPADRDRSGLRRAAAGPALCRRTAVQAAP